MTDFDQTREPHKRFCLHGGQVLQIVTSSYRGAPGTYKWILADPESKATVAVVTANSRRDVEAKTAATAATMLSVPRVKYKRDKAGHFVLDARGKRVTLTAPV